jgi:hypothetical protein
LIGVLSGNSSKNLCCAIQLKAGPYISNIISGACVSSGSLLRLMGLLGESSSLFRVFYLIFLAKEAKRLWF